MPDKNKIAAAIGQIIDPDLGQSLEQLNAIKSITIGDSNVAIGLELTGPVNYAAKIIESLCTEKVRELYPDIKPDVSISENYPDSKNRNFLKGVKNIIAVASGKGGVGKSAISSNIAAALALSGAKTGILDGDVYGPSQPTMFGMSDQRLVAETDSEGNTVAYPREKYGVKVASMGFVMNRDEAAIVRGPMLAGYFSMLFEQV
ncbi:MAG: P-loop NTPase, partial [Bacteroidota bacterium]